MGNERVDKLAGQGRDTGLRVGGRQLVLRDLTTRPSSSSVSADVFVDRLRMAAKKSFSFTEYAPRAPWITETTFKALEDSKFAEANNHPDAKHLRN